MENLYTPNCIRSFTGKYVNVSDPKPQMFCIEDIAHALSYMPRFTGHTKHFLSVGFHSINCCRLARFRKLSDIQVYTCLMHDATEAYMADVASPVKKFIPGYKELEDKLHAFLARLFGFEFPFPDYVKEVDTYALEMEWDHFMLKGENPGEAPKEVEETFIQFHQYFQKYL